MFKANEMVTADNLNNVAIDLGASTFGVFTEGAPFAVTELNNITKELTSKGILQALNKCKPSLSDLTVTIDTGVIVFADGSKVRIAEAKTFVLEDTTTASYIYAVKNIITNNITLQLTSAPITQGDFVEICKVENGKLTDTREMSLSKTTIGTANAEFIVLSEEFIVSKQDKITNFKIPIRNINARMIMMFTNIATRQPLGLSIVNSDLTEKKSYSVVGTSTKYNLQIYENATSENVSMSTGISMYTGSGFNGSNIIAEVKGAFLEVQSKDANGHDAFLGTTIILI